MKAIKSGLILKNVAAGVAITFLVLASCQKETSILDSTDTQTVNAESASSAYVSETSDMSSSVVGDISGTQYAGGRETADTIRRMGDWDDRLKCAVVTIVRTGTIAVPAGTITINFGTSGTCADKRGVVRKGEIIISYFGRRWMPGSYFIVSLIDFYRNDIHIEGTDSIRTILSADSLHLQFNSRLSGGKITFGDGRFITREHNLTREWLRDYWYPLNSEWLTLKDGTASGQNKNGNTYQMQITKTLVHKMACLVDKVFIPVSGTKVVTVTTPTATKEYDINYGEGACDNEITVTINGKLKTITVNGEGD